MILNLPFSSLRAFEATVRRKGFSAAAEELGVSQSAVSQHVKSLEEWLGQELLVRGARRSTPTRHGLMLSQEIALGLGGISEVCSEIRHKNRSDKSIVISCLPGFAYTWLFPRLLRFELENTDLSISIATDTGHQPFSSAVADIGIRYGVGEHPGLQVDHLMGEHMFPVCAPSLLKGARALKDIDDLAHHSLFQDEFQDFGAANPTWDFWADACGVTLPRGLTLRRFGQSNMVIQAAIEGVGVALGREPLVVDALQDGRLVRPFPQVAKSPLSYWLVRRKEKHVNPKIEEFLNWIIKEARTQPVAPEFEGNKN